MPSYLVTGGAGFIGSAYAKHLLHSNIADEVVIVDDLTYAGNLANLKTVIDHPKLMFVKGNICDAEIMSKLIANADVVINFAAETHVDRSITGSNEFIVSNVLGLNTILQIAKNHPDKRFIQIGTDEVYGSIESGSWTEQDVLLPNSPYAASKASAELLARSYFQTYGVNVSTTRCSNNFGPFQYPEKVIPLFVTNLIEGKKIPVYGTGMNIRDWLHVDDHVRGIQLVVDNGLPGESYNIGGGTELTNLALAHRILKEFDLSESMIEYVADRKGHDLRYSVDDSKVRKLGYEPRLSFDETISQTINWYRENEQWWRPLK